MEERSSCGDQNQQRYKQRYVNVSMWGSFSMDVVFLLMENNGLHAGLIDISGASFLGLHALMLFRLKVCDL